jgi:uncharacterized protein (TIGR03663 family)
MTKALYGILVALALVTGLAFRLARLDARPMHHDEANQAVKFGALLEAGDYRYDASDHHGPTLYYLTLPAAWLRGQRTLAALDEVTVRLVPAAFGAALILLMLPLARGLGRPAVVAAAALAAVSPALTYYSRFYIQEMVFAWLSLAFLVAAGRYVEKPGVGAALWAGLAAGLAMATKETWMITLPAATVACVVANRQGWSFRPHVRHLAAALFAALLVACVFYSSFFTNPSGVLGWIESFPVYGQRGLGGGRHVQPWFYYLHVLGFWRSGGLLFTEAFVLLLGVVGVVLAVRIRLKPDSTSDACFWPQAIAVYAILTTLVFSAIPYKTPWNLVPFYTAVVVLAGYGAGQLVALTQRPVLRTALIGLFILGTWHLATEAWRADVRYAADPRNPYVYAHTSTDFLRLPERISTLAALHPDGPRTLVKVLAGPYEQWPLPWYLRKLERVGYWSSAPDAAPLDDAPLLVASEDNAAAVDAALGDRYVSEFYGLRPGALLTLYVERGLWERYLARTAGK